MENIFATHADTTRSTPSASLQAYGPRPGRSGAGANWILSQISILRATSERRVSGIQWLTDHKIREKANLRQNLRVTREPQEGQHGRLDHREYRDHADWCDGRFPVEATPGGPHCMLAAATGG